ncbi:hypothetical protein HGRIS_007076 [Hohenbuehelia grisea]|uniref:BTB domain-containing protein n=1 Tax=Hohenbuehelia grisea TaxID=104357 RepID=A0ABR3JBB1_9AGAR
MKMIKQKPHAQRVAIEYIQTYISQIDRATVYSFSELVLSMQSEDEITDIVPSPITSDGAGPPILRKHAEYYLDDGNIVLQVADTLFRVHRHFLVKYSPRFEEIISSRSAEHDAASSGPSSEPIVLSDIQSSDAFASLLWLFYNDLIEEFNASASTWASISDVADKYKMNDIHRIATEFLGNIPAFPMVSILLTKLHWGNDTVYPKNGRWTPILSSSEVRTPSAPRKASGWDRRLGHA